MENFELPVDHKGKELSFPARLLRFGYTYRIEVDVEGEIIVFDRDEERNWRAIIDPNTNNSINTALIHAIYNAVISLGQ